MQSVCTTRVRAYSVGTDSSTCAPSLTDTLLASVQPVLEPILRSVLGVVVDMKVDFEVDMFWNRVNGQRVIQV